MSGSTNLLASWEEQEEVVDGWRRITIGPGDPHTRAILDAVVDRYNAVTGRPRPTEEDLYDLIGQKVTLVQSGENYIGGRLLNAQEGKLFTGTRGYGILPKGARSKGFVVRPEKVVDVLPGYATDEAVKLVAEVRAKLPVLKPLTQERLDELPYSSQTLSLCLFGGYATPEGVQPDAIYLASGYYGQEDDIVEGVVLLRPEYGFSEHGSIYGKQLLGLPMGEVVGFQPISFAEGIKLCDVDYDEAFYMVTCWQADAA